MTQKVVQKVNTTERKISVGHCSHNQQKEAMKKFLMPWISADQQGYPSELQPLADILLDHKK